MGRRKKGSVVAATAAASKGNDKDNTADSDSPVEEPVVSVVAVAVAVAVAADDDDNDEDAKVTATATATVPATPTTPNIQPQDKAEDEAPSSTSTKKVPVSAIQTLFSSFFARQAAPKPSDTVVVVPAIVVPSTKPRSKNTKARSTNGKRLTRAASSTTTTASKDHDADHNLLDNFNRANNANKFSPFSQAHRHISYIRFFLFAIMIFEYLTWFPHYKALDVSSYSCYVPNDDSCHFNDDTMYLDAGSDSWFAHDLFEYVAQHLLGPRLPYTGDVGVDDQTNEEYDDDDEKPLFDREKIADGSLWLQTQFHLWYAGGIFWGCLAIYEGIQQQQQHHHTTTTKTEWMPFIHQYLYTTSVCIFLFMYTIRMYSAFYLYSDVHYLLLCMAILVTVLHQHDDCQGKLTKRELPFWKFVIAKCKANYTYYTTTTTTSSSSSSSKRSDSKTTKSSTTNTKQSKRQQSSKRKSTTKATTASTITTSKPTPTILPPHLFYNSPLNSWTTTTIFLLRFQLAVVMLWNGMIHRYRQPVNGNKTREIKDWWDGTRIRQFWVMKDLRKLYEHYKSEQEALEEDPQANATAFQNQHFPDYPKYPYTIPNSTEKSYHRVQYNTESSLHKLYNQQLGMATIPSKTPTKVLHDDAAVLASIFTFVVLYINFRVWFGRNGKWWRRKRTGTKQSNEQDVNTITTSATTSTGMIADFLQRLHWITWFLHVVFAGCLMWYQYKCIIIMMESGEEFTQARQVGYVMIVLGYWIWKSYDHPTIISIYYTAKRKATGDGMDDDSVITEMSLVGWSLHVFATVLFEPFRPYPKELRKFDINASKVKQDEVTNLTEQTDNSAAEDANSNTPANDSDDKNTKPGQLESKSSETASSEQSKIAELQRAAKKKQLHQQQLLQDAYRQKSKLKWYYAIVSLIWIIVQTLLPLRMILIQESSYLYPEDRTSRRSSYRWTGLGERYGWTQWMGWTRTSIITHTGSHVRQIENDEYYNNRKEKLDRGCTEQKNGRIYCPLEIVDPKWISKTKPKMQSELLHRTLQFRLGYIVASCRGHGYMIQSDYMIMPPLMEYTILDDGSREENSHWKELELRTMPLGQMLSPRIFNGLERYPRQWARVGSGIARALETSCSDLQLDVYNFDTYEDARVYGVLFQQLNGRGPFHRILDPTMDLEQIDQARRKIQSFSSIFNSWKSRSAWFRSIVMEQYPRKYENILRGIGTLRDTALETYEPNLWKKYPDARAIHIIADRGACLQESTVFLWPNEFPITLAALHVPFRHELFIQGQRRQKFYKRQAGYEPQYDKDGEEVSEFQTFWSQQLGSMSDRIPLRLNNDRKIVTTSLEIGIQPIPLEPMVDKDGNSYKLGNCRDTVYEDVLWAIIFES